MTSKVRNIGFRLNIGNDTGYHSLFLHTCKIRAVASNTIPSAVDVTEYLSLLSVARLRWNFQHARSLKLLCHSAGSITVP